MSEQELPDLDPCNTESDGFGSAPDVSKPFPSGENGTSITDPQTDGISGWSVDANGDSIWVETIWDEATQTFIHQDANGNPIVPGVDFFPLPDVEYSSRTITRCNDDGEWCVDILYSIAADGTRTEVDRKYLDPQGIESPDPGDLVVCEPEAQCPCCTHIIERQVYEINESEIIGENQMYGSWGYFNAEPNENGTAGFGSMNPDGTVNAVFRNEPGLITNANSPNGFSINEFNALGADSVNRRLYGVNRLFPSNGAQQSLFRYDINGNAYNIVGVINQPGTTTPENSIITAGDYDEVTGMYYYFLSALNGGTLRSLNVDTLQSVDIPIDFTVMNNASKSWFDITFYEGGLYIRADEEIWLVEGVTSGDPPVLFREMIGVTSADDGGGIAILDANNTGDFRIYIDGSNNIYSAALTQNGTDAAVNEGAITVPGSGGFTRGGFADLAASQVISSGDQTITPLVLAACTNLETGEIISAKYFDLSTGEPVEYTPTGTVVNSLPSVADGFDIPNNSTSFAFPAGMEKVKSFAVSREGSTTVTVNFPSGNSVTIHRNGSRSWNADDVGSDYLDTTGITFDTGNDSSADVAVVI